jgi:hypothetical protein
MKTDEIAKHIALTRGVIPECLHTPIAAVDEDAISNYIGEIVDRIVWRATTRAVLVRVPPAPPRDKRLPIWELPGSAVFFRQTQLWVDVSYTKYRRAYRRLLPNENTDGKIVSHAMNRRVAALKGYTFVRATLTSRANNSSSAYSENWGVDLYNDTRDAVTRRRGAFIQYADLSDLMLMADMKLGGGVMALVNEGQKLLEPRTDG